MNPAQLRRLLELGLISQERHARLAAAAVAGDRSRPTLDVHVPGIILAASEEHDADPAAGSDEVVGGQLTGTITAYDEYIPSHGMILHTGSMNARQPLERVKLLRDHNHTEPIGYMLELDDAATTATFQVASTEIARVAQEVGEKLRDGLSVGFAVTDYDFDDDWTLHVYAAELYEVSVCAIPAIADAGVTDVAASLTTTPALTTPRKDPTVNKAQLAAALAAGTITQEAHDAALATLDLVSAAPAAVAPEVAAGPQLNEAQPPAARTTDRSLSLAQVNARLAAAANTGDLAGFTLALADVIPAHDAGAAFLRPDWQGEAWRYDDNLRPWIDAFGAPAELTSLKGQAWEWGQADEDGDGGEPEVAEYAGNKTEVASNEIGTAPREFNAFRIAAGFDVDRAFEDFASEEFWSAFWAAVMRSYKRKSNAGIRTRVLAKASAPTGTVATGGVKAVLKQVIRDVRPFGRANRIFLGDDLFDQLADIEADKLPLWLSGYTIGVDLAEGTADAAKLAIVNDSTLAAKQVVAFDSRAATVREKAPFRLQALNIGRAGIDVGIYSYLRLDDQDTRAIVKRTYTGS